MSENYRDFKSYELKMDKSQDYNNNYENYEVNGANKRENLECGDNDKIFNYYENTNLRDRPETRMQKQRTPRNNPNNFNINYSMGEYKKENYSGFQESPIHDLVQKDDDNLNNSSGFKLMKETKTEEFYEVDEFGNEVLTRSKVTEKRRKNSQERSAEKYNFEIQHNSSKYKISDNDNKINDIIPNTSNYEINDDKINIENIDTKINKETEIINNQNENAENVINTNTNSNNADINNKTDTNNGNVSENTQKYYEYYKPSFIPKKRNNSSRSSSNNQSNIQSNNTSFNQITKRVTKTRQEFSISDISRDNSFHSYNNFFAPNPNDKFDYYIDNPKETTANYSFKEKNLSFVSNQVPIAKLNTSKRNYGFHEIKSEVPIRRVQQPQRQTRNVEYTQTVIKPTAVTKPSTSARAVNYNHEIISTKGPSRGRRYEYKNTQSQNVQEIRTQTQHQNEAKSDNYVRMYNRIQPKINYVERIFGSSDINDKNSDKSYYTRTSNINNNTSTTSNNYDNRQYTHNIRRAEQKEYTNTTNNNYSTRQYDYNVRRPEQKEYINTTNNYSTRQYDYNIRRPEQKEYTNITNCSYNTRQYDYNVRRAEQNQYKKINYVNNNSTNRVNYEIKPYNYNVNRTEENNYRQNEYRQNEYRQNEYRQNEYRQNTRSDNLRNDRMNQSEINEVRTGNLRYKKYNIVQQSEPNSKGKAYLTTITGTEYTEVPKYEYVETVHKIGTNREEELRNKKIDEDLRNKRKATNYRYFESVSNFKKENKAIVRHSNRNPNCYVYDM